MNLYLEKRFPALEHLHKSFVCLFFSDLLNKALPCYSSHRIELIKTIWILSSCRYILSISNNTFQLIKQIFIIQTLCKLLCLILTYKKSYIHKTSKKITNRFFSFLKRRSDCISKCWYSCFAFWWKRRQFFQFEPVNIFKVQFSRPSNSEKSNLKVGQKTYFHSDFKSFSDFEPF